MASCSKGCDISSRPSAAALHCQLWHGGGTQACCLIVRLSICFACRRALLACETPQQEGIMTQLSAILGPEGAAATHHGRPCPHLSGLFLCMQDSNKASGQQHSPHLQAEQLLRSKRAQSVGQHEPWCRATVKELHMLPLPQLQPMYQAHISSFWSAGMRCWLAKLQQGGMTGLPSCRLVLMVWLPLKGLYMGLPPSLCPLAFIGLLCVKAICASLELR